MKQPFVTEGVGFIHYTWIEYDLRIMVERIKDDGYAELSFFSGDLLLHTTRANLMSTTTMNSLAKRLKENSDTTPWTDVLTYITGKTMQITRKGEPAVEIWPSEESNLEVEYLLNPILYLNHPTVIFGDYGSLKSLIALTLCYLVQLPYYDNDLGLITAKKAVKCLYADYEDDASSFRRRWSAFDRGFNKGVTPILYSHLTKPLADSVEEVKRTVVENDINFLIIDSLAPAAGGKINEPEPAILYHKALREINITNLTLAHTSKDQLVKSKSIFGSIFFTNLARSVWFCKSQQEPGEKEAVVSLKHTKGNLSQLHSPLGFRFDFNCNSISVTKADLKDTGLSGELPLSIQIKNVLRHGTMNIKDIAERLDHNEASVRTVIYRMNKKDILIKVGEAWGLKELV